MEDSLQTLDSTEVTVISEVLFGFPVSVPAAARMYKNCGAWKKRLDDREKKLRSFLRDQIQVEENSEGKGEAVVEGVKRKVWYQKSVAYSKALAEIKELLVPKTKWEEADQIIEAFTSTSIRDSFEEEAEDEFGV